MNFMQNISNCVPKTTVSTRLKARTSIYDIKIKGGVAIARVTLSVLALGGAFGAIEMATSKTANAAGVLEYTVDPNTADGGVFARSSPHTDDTQRIAGYGVYPNQTVKLLCGVTDGDPVGQYQNTTWHFVTNLSNPGEGNFWLNDHYIQSPNVASQLTPGESTCPNESSDPMQSTSSQQPAGHLPCTPFLIIGARGSGQPYEEDAAGITGFGSPLTPIAHALIFYYGKENVTTYGLHYPAINAGVNTILQPEKYINSVITGETELRDLITNQAKACSNQIMEILGYSQGADVVNDTIAVLDPSTRSYIGAVVTFGDPHFNSHNSEDRGTFTKGFDGSLGPRNELPGDVLPKAQSYCDSDDFICNASPRSSATLNYSHSHYGQSDTLDAMGFLESLHSTDLNDLTVYA